MIVINTRPTDRAAALTDACIQVGYGVLALPLLELHPVAYHAALQSLYTQLASAQVIVVVSPTAVKIGMQYLVQSGISLAQLKHIQWIAVGAMTAQALADYDIHAQVPDVETSEGMLSLPIFQNMPQLSRIAFWRGEGGRQFMMQQCQHQQMEVLNFVLYERGCPPSTATWFKLNFQTWWQEHQLDPCGVCISSEASWNNWKQLADPLFLQHCHYFVLGERLYTLLHEDLELNSSIPCDNVIRVESLKPEVLLQAIAELQRKS